MKQDDFSRPERLPDGRYVAHCVYGGCVVDPSRRGVERQIAAADREQWEQWIRGKREDL